jgi:phage shock protein C
MFCTSCGHQINADARFCSQCGQSTGNQAAGGGQSYAPRRLYRLTRDKTIAGICAGLAKYLDVDVTLVRFLTLVVTVLTGVIPGVIAYLLAMLIMPKDENADKSAQAPVSVQS